MTTIKHFTSVLVAYHRIREWLGTHQPNSSFKFDTVFDRFPSLRDKWIDPTALSTAGIVASDAASLSAIDVSKCEEPEAVQDFVTEYTSLALQEDSNYTPPSAGKAPADEDEDDGKAPEVVDKTMAATIDSLLKMAVKDPRGGDVTVSSLLANTRLKAKARAELKLAREENAKLTAALSQRVAVASQGSVPMHTGPLTYKVRMESVGTIFGKARTAALKFDTPVLDWFDDKGNQVQHPDVPKIDPDYKFDSEKLLNFMTSSNANRNMWLFGHHGTGKTTFVEQIAARTGFPFHRINLDSDITRMELVGKVDIINSNGVSVTQFTPGILPNVLPTPCYLTFDEYDAGKPDIMFIIQRVLEGKGLLVMEDGGRVVHGHELLHITATANTRGQGDEDGIYPGVRAMNGSTLDRFPVFIEFDYMAGADEEALLKQRYPALKADIAERLVKFAGEIRKAFVNGEVFTTISPRGLFAMAENHIAFTSLGAKPNAALKQAIGLSVINKATRDTRQRYVEILNRIANLQE